MDWFKENYPTGRLYTFTGSGQGSLPGLKAKETFVNGRPYPFRALESPNKSLYRREVRFFERCFCMWHRGFVDPGMLKEFEII